MLPRPIKNFTDAFARLPSIGPRAAIRLAFHIIKKTPEEASALSKALADLARVNECPSCFFVKDTEAILCPICQNPNRDQGVIAIVEKETDVLTLERTGAFRGTYFVLGPQSERGVLNETQKAKLAKLKACTNNKSNGRIREVIVAINPSVTGDLIYDLIKRELGKAISVTRLGRGIPTGGEIEFADSETLRNALERRG